MDFEDLTQAFCAEYGIFVLYCEEMPPGYETAYGTYDGTLNALFFNAALLSKAPEYEQFFYLYHELRHALQYERPELFSEAVRESSRYVIQYDGTCFALRDERWYTCHLAGNEETFSALYLGQPYERDANQYACDRVREMCGDSDGLRELAAFWLPPNPPAYETYEKLYEEIDRLTGA